MPLVKSVEKKIWDVEDFAVIIKTQDGKDKRGDPSLPVQYPYTDKAKNNYTVKEWKENRFNKTYPGFAVDVLTADGASVKSGHTLLGTVRDTYSDDE